MLGNIGCGEHVDDETEGSAKDRGLRPGAPGACRGLRAAAPIAEACAEGGVAAIEIAFTVPCAANVIRDLAQRFTTNEILIGAGTVLDLETARVATLPGAQFVVSPILNPETARLCNRHQVPYIPDASTLKEVIEGMQCGADIVVFPAETLGRAFVKAVRGAPAEAGVTLGNVGEWIQAGCVAVGVGGSLTAGSKDGRLPIYHRDVAAFCCQDPPRA